MNWKAAEHTLLGSLSDLAAQGNNGQIRATVGPVFELPFPAGAIPLDGWVDIWVRAVAATDLPALAVVSDGTVASEGPNVLKRENARLVLC